MRAAVLALQTVKLCYRTAGMTLARSPSTTRSSSQPYGKTALSAAVLVVQTTNLRYVVREACLRRLRRGLPPFLGSASVVETVRTPVCDSDRIELGRVT